jgi:Rieske Fe-S protein
VIARRAFLKVVAGAAAANACSAAAAGPADVGDVTAGTAADLRVGTLSALPGEPVCIGRDAQGIYAMTLTCTHAGCDIGQQGSVSSQGLDCGCHGSRFDAVGNVLRGPAGAPLAHFAVSADASGLITVHTGSEVDPGTRLTLA